MTPTARKTLLSILTALAFGSLAIVGSFALAGHHKPTLLKTATTGELGTFFVAPNGMTLYIFDKDTEPGKSACHGGCARAWPPFSPQAGDPEPVAPLSIITRDDGSKQYAYKGKPLYFYKRDKKPGDTNGHGAGKRWWVAKP